MKLSLILKNVLFKGLFILSILIFILFCFFTYMGIENKDSLLNVLFELIYFGFLFSGFNIVLMTYYFFIYLSDWLDNLTGLIIVIFAILIHIIISAFFGHAGNEILFIGYIFELIISILIIYIYMIKNLN